MTTLHTLFCKHHAMTKVQSLNQTNSFVQSCHVLKYLGNVAPVCLMPPDLVSLFRPLLLITLFSCDDA